MSVEAPQFKTTNSRNRISKKILVVGPPKAGKTLISTFLGEYMGDDSTEFELEFYDSYRATKGVRIVEFESQEFSVEGNRMEIEVQLWDVSGDIKYEDCWPAIKEGVHGVILVANPDEHQGADLQMWYEEFIEKTHLSLDSVLVLLNEMGEKRTNDGVISDFKIQPPLNSAVCVACNLRFEGQNLKVEVNQFLISIIMQDDPHHRKPSSSESPPPGKAESDENIDDDDDF
ncbi:unnamed protein product [Caenorhabditis auriculariae]|uniref:Uncharacterized protein n=1 Tax=Caenorhabditis auriculariae TaxID=2777116 RepID=A0A8S1HQ31_9PELO|nr:unnamed protein product [Caenorhabditis auriculariae]